MSGGPSGPAHDINEAIALDQLRQDRWSFVRPRHEEALFPTEHLGVETDRLLPVAHAIDEADELNAPSDLRRHREYCPRRIRPGGDRRAELAQKEDLGRVCDLKGIFPRPDALCIAVAKGIPGKRPKLGCANGLASLEERKKRMTELKDWGRQSGAAGRNGRRGAHGRDDVHGNPVESEK